MTGRYGTPPPASGRRSRRLTVGLPLAVVLYLGAGAALVAPVLTTVGHEVWSAQAAASDYAMALVDERFAEAQQMFCARDKAAISAASLAEHYFRPELTAYRVEGVDVAASEGTLTARVAVWFTTAGGLVDSADLPLVKENGAWRPCP